MAIGSAYRRHNIVTGTTWTILLFWIAQFCLLTVQRQMMMPEDWYYLLPRSFVTLAGICLSFALAWVIRRCRLAGVRFQLVSALLAALAACCVHAAANFAIFGYFMPKENWESADLASYFVAVVQWFWSYAALAALLMVITYSVEIGDRERRIAHLRREADAAQVRALRYQLNPHFMFNTLNSIAALIGRREADTAETMVENLSDFLRASLSLDPQDEIPLAREIELQSLYVGIEAVRFADRLQVRIDIDHDAGRGLVPSLLLQPLIENAVTHSVARSLQAVTLTVHAWVTGDMLEISVRNSSGAVEREDKRGTGVGLANVRDRLIARYGDQCSLRARPVPGGGFLVNLSLPYATAESG